MDDSVPLMKLVNLFLVLFVIGLGLTFPLFRFDLNKFVRSALFTKILVWIPIFWVFVAVLYLNNPGRLIILIALLAICLWELLKIRVGRHQRLMTYTYFTIFGLAMASTVLIATVYHLRFINLLITLCFATVLGDITAFFLGSYAGWHKLPDNLNSRKSWEGVLGQIIGALLGVLLVNIFVEPVITIWLFVPIGVGGALGDLSNSYIKRRLGVKDWSRNLPGHGGYIDRLSSIAGAAALLFCFLQATNYI